MSCLAKKSVLKSDQRIISKTRRRPVKRLRQQRGQPWIETNSVCAVAEKKLFEKNVGKIPTSLSPTKSKNHIVSVEKPLVSCSPKRKVERVGNLSIKPLENVSKSHLAKPKILENKPEVQELSSLKNILKPLPNSTQPFEDALKPMDSIPSPSVNSKSIIDDTDNIAKEPKSSLSAFTVPNTTFHSASDVLKESPQVDPVVSNFFQNNDLTSLELNSLSSVWWKSPEKSKGNSKILNCNKPTKTASSNSYQCGELSTAFESLTNDSWNTIPEEPALYEETLDFNSMQSLLNLDNFRLVDDSIVVEAEKSNSTTETSSWPPIFFCNNNRDENNSSDIMVTTCNLDDITMESSSVSQLKETLVEKSNIAPPPAVLANGFTMETQSFLQLLSDDSTFFSTENINTVYKSSTEGQSFMQLLNDDTSLSSGRNGSILQAVPENETLGKDQSKLDQSPKKALIENHLILGLGKLIDLNTPNGCLFVCNVCGDKFLCTQKLEEHFTLHKNTSFFGCQLCRKEFSVREDLVNHLICHKKKQTFKCSHCFIDFKSKYLLKRHMESHIEPSESPVVNFDIDQQALHGAKGAEGTLFCKVCGKNFLTKNSFEIHVSKHHEDRPHRCVDCNKAFKLKSHLTEHIRIHNRLPDFQCPSCEKAFYTQYKLKRHMRVHTGEKPFVCQKCGATFRNSGTLKRHTFTHETVTLECLVCGKKLKSMETLVVHNRTHTGEKPYICNICHFSGNDASNFRRHLKIKHNLILKNKT